MYTISELKTIVASCNTVEEVNQAKHLIKMYVKPLPLAVALWLIAAFKNREFAIQRLQRISN